MVRIGESVKHAAIIGESVGFSLLTLKLCQFFGVSIVEVGVAAIVVSALLVLVFGLISIKKDQANAKNSTTEG